MDPLIVTPRRPTLRPLSKLCYIYQTSVQGFQETPT